MNNPFVRTVEVSDTEWRALSETSLVAHVTVLIWTSISTSAPLSIRVDGGAEAQLVRTSFELDGVDLSRIEVKGPTSYRVTIVGYSR